MTQTRRVLLIIGGGIAAYKSLELIRLLRKRNILVRGILTDAGAQFVTPLSVSGLTGDKVYQSLFDLTDEADMGHIQLSRAADLVVVAPATADLMAKAAQGLAGDLASTALLATDKPVLMAPAMNVRMWHHPATQRNLARLKADGVLFVGPGEGEMACGEFGLGRMAEPEEIARAIDGFFASQGAGLAQSNHKPLDKLLAGRRVLVTAGPTHEPIDPVRYIANRSSGKQGYAIALAAAQLGAETILVSGPVHLPEPIDVTLVRVETAEEMKRACLDALPVDAAIFTAAVADWRVANQAGQKLKKAKGGLPGLALTENPDILHEVATLTRNRPALVVGFAAETENVVEEAKAKRARKSCDWMVANDVSPGTGIMGGERNTVHLITEKDAESWPELSKSDVGLRLMERIAAHFQVVPGKRKAAPRG